MKRRTFVASTVTTGTSLALAASTSVFAQTDTGAATPSSAGEDMTGKPLQTGYAPVNGLQMYYEIHGSGGVLLLILHGAFGTVDMFGPLVPALAETRQVITVEMQGHGRTADVDRPLTYEQLADDVAALVQYVGSEQVDVFGYSLGGFIAQQVAIRHPELVRKLVVASASFNREGVYPEVWEGIEALTPALFEGSPPQTEYARLAPNPEDWPTLIEKVKELEREFVGWPAEEIAAIESPTLLIIGDGDIVRLDHAAEMIQLLGGGVPADFGSASSDQLAVLPGTSHVDVMLRTDWLLPMITQFLDAPTPEPT